MPILPSDDQIKWFIQGLSELASNDVSAKSWIQETKVRDRVIEASMN